MTNTAMIDVPASWSPPRHLFWAMLWIVVTVLFTAVLVLQWPRVVGREFSSWSAWGSVAILPFFTAAAAICCVVLAIRAVPRRRAYLASTTAGQRAARLEAVRSRAPWAPQLVISGVACAIWLAGVVGFAVAAPGWESSAVLMALGLLAMLAMGWIPLLHSGLACRAARSRATGYASPLPAPPS